MGAQASKLVLKSYDYVTGNNSKSNASANSLMKHQCLSVKATAFVWTRASSMYFDEDGQLAHEFYCEVPTKSGRRVRLKRIKTGLVPQGEVQLDNPRLHVDYPIILYEAR